MKKIYGISFLAAALVLSAAYYGSYRYSVYRTEQQQVAENDKKQIKINEETLNVGKGDSEVVTNQTVYVLHVYDAKEDKTEKQELPLPADFLGKDREGLTEYLKNYTDTPSEEEAAKGFVNFELISFSSDKIILKKTYYPPDTEYQFCLVPEDGYVTVYTADFETVYAYTDIQLKNLPSDLKKEIKRGKYLSDISELYDFLENYSS